MTRSGTIRHEPVAPGIDESSDVSGVPSQPFGMAYADVYDALYHDKDYAAECDLIARCCQDAVGSVRSIVDLGCGTGRHAELLARRGYRVVGVDRSSTMIEHARRRTGPVSTKEAPEYHVSDVRTFRTPDCFDAAVMMFAVMSYQVEDDDVIAVLRTARTLLREGGLLLFDCWYGPAVMHERPASRTKQVASGNSQIVRTSTSSLDAKRSRVTVRFDVRQIGGGVGVESHETHTMRYFFPTELEAFLRATGFLLVRIGAMPEFEQEPDETTWNVLVSARAVRQA